MLKRLASLVALVLLSGPAAAQGPAFPVHGNWCGPNFGAGPILDALDAACFRHDMCSGQMGAFNCGCDLAFMSELRSQPWPNPGLAQKARAVFEAIALVPCTDPVGQSEKMHLAATDWARGVVAGREAPTAILDRLGRLMAEGIARAR